MKKEDILRKRNTELSKQLEEAKLELTMQKDMNSESAVVAKELIRKLEALKLDMVEALNDIDNLRNEYEKLVAELKEFRNSVKGRNAIERWVYSREPKRK